MAHRPMYCSNSNRNDCTFWRSVVSINKYILYDITTSVWREHKHYIPVGQCKSGVWHPFPVKSTRVKTSCQQPRQPPEAKSIPLEGVSKFLFFFHAKFHVDAE